MKIIIQSDVKNSLKKIIVTRNNSSALGIYALGLMYNLSRLFVERSVKFQVAGYHPVNVNKNYEGKVLGDCSVFMTAMSYNVSISILFH